MENQLESVVNRSFDKTGLRYKQLTDKYYIVFQEDQNSKRKVRKIARKFEQIQKLEESESLSVQKSTKDSSANLRNVIRQIRTNRTGAKNLEKRLPLTPEIF